MTKAPRGGPQSPSNLAGVAKNLFSLSGKADLNRTVFDQAKQIAWLERLVTDLLVEYRGSSLMPPQHLRMHVGARDSAANFWNQGRESSRRVLEVFGEAPGGPVLDWGCGSGRTLYWLFGHEAWREAYRGCDVDAEAIAWLNKQKTGAQVKVCGDGPPLPYGDGELVGLFGFSVLTHVHPARHGDWLREFHRVLKPGGRAYLTVNGESRLTDKRAFSNSSRATFAKQGWFFETHEGHYKSAAIVSRTHLISATRGLFEVEQYREAGYHEHDDLILRKL